jgi:threonyl-tRNA synthetase
MQPAYMVILGDGEVETRTVSLRARNGDQVSGIPLDEFLKDLKTEIEDKVVQPSLAVSPNGE